jgi:hypothetical protein
LGVDESGTDVGVASGVDAMPFALGASHLNVMS